MRRSTFGSWTARTGRFRCVVYVPDAPIGSGLVWLHGGGFAFGDLDQPEADWVSRRLAGGGVTVVSVAYRLAPQRDFSRSDSPVSGGVHFPVASEEVSAASEWACASFAELGLSPETWSLGGASAGANLAAGAAFRARDKGRPQPRSLLLAYPALHAELPLAGAELRVKLDALQEESFPPDLVRRMNLNYVDDPALLASPYAFPGGQDLRGLPPTFILNSDVDGLLPSGESFASEIAAAGVDLLLIREDGTGMATSTSRARPAPRAASSASSRGSSPTRSWGLPTRRHTTLELLHHD